MVTCEEALLVLEHLVKDKNHDPLTNPLFGTDIYAALALVLPFGGRVDHELAIVTGCLDSVGRYPTIALGALIRV